MNFDTSKETEISRIRAAYERQQYTVPRDRYSPFTEGYLLAILELQREIVRLLRRSQRTCLEQQNVLDVGCGTGFWLRQFVQWGARPENLVGVDLLQRKILKCVELCPKGITLQCGCASELEFEDGKFDLILQFTVFTSILDPLMKANVAKEMIRVLKPGGAIVWYDYFVSHPNNPDVRGVRRAEIFRLFPGLSIHLKRITLAPPLARAIGPISPALYWLLSVVKPLCTHYLGLIQKKE